MRNRSLVLFLLAGTPVLPLCAQDTQDSQAVLLKILQRLDALEQENKQLVQEVHDLKQTVAASQPQAAATQTQTQNASTEERLAVDENRIEEQAQTKVEASQKFPISLSGMLLFNAFRSTPTSIDTGNESYSSLLSGPSTSGATLRQTIIGLQFQGPSLPGGGQVHGSLAMDFGTGFPEDSNWLRLREGTLSFDWPNRSFSVGQDKPLISPYEPDSLAEVAIPPLAGAGNLWLWLPQARYEERLHFGADSGLNIQAAMMETDERYDNAYAYVQEFEPVRPAAEGRIAFWHKFDDQRKIEIGAGVHASTTHVAYTSANSRIAALDWRIIPWSHLQLTGTVYHGQNVAGLGAIGNGVSIFPDGTVRAVHTWGGWSQVAFPITRRLTFNIFSGIEDDRASDLLVGSITRNWSYAGNLVYHLGPNVVVSAEALQMRLLLLSGLPEIRNNYDLAFGYLF